MGSRLRESSYTPLRVSTNREAGRNMSEQPESYEAPTVEEIDTDGKPIAVASEAAISS